jgi:hypothetical protein
MAVQRYTTLLVIAGILTALSTIATAAEPRGPNKSTQITAGAVAVRPAPWISAKVAPPVRKRIEASFEMAADRLDQSPECRALFSGLGVDGLETLSSTLYYPASTANEKKLCRGAWGYTTVGTAPTFVCRRFSRISEREGALILIHEALHHAGLDEFPRDPKGLTSKAINRLVEDACRF